MAQVAAMARIRSLAQELLNAVDVAKKKEKNVMFLESSRVTVENRYKFIRKVKLTFCFRVIRLIFYTLFEINGNSYV